MIKRTVVNKPASVAMTVTDGDGRSIALDPANLELTVESYDGRSIETSVLDVGQVSEGIVAFGIPASELPGLDLLTATLTESGSGVVEVATIEVVGAHYFTIDDVRYADSTMRENVSRFSDDEIIRVRPEVEQECERICGRAFVPRLSRQLFTGGRTTFVELQGWPIRRIHYAEIDGAALDSSELESLTEWLGKKYEVNGDYFKALLSGSQLDVVYEHGISEPPADLKRAAIAHLKHMMTKDSSTHDERYTSISNPDGTFGIATPGRAGFEVGLPYVDAVYGRYRRFDPTFA